MKTRLFYTTGNRDLHEEEWDKPDPSANQMEVKNVYTGVCRSDIDMYNGQFMCLPKHIQGHEGIGIVTRVGSLIRGFKEGDYVATRGEPSFADYYNCWEADAVLVPELAPKYIIEPVACGVNIAKSLRFDIEDENEVLVLGTGFLATVVVECLSAEPRKITVVGSANQEHWSKLKNVHHAKDISELGDRKFFRIIDLSEKPEYTNMPIYGANARVVIAAEKHPQVTTSFAQLLWNSVEVSFPSPRNLRFHSCMEYAVNMVKTNKRLDFEKFWTQEYSRDTEIKQAFEDGLNRPQGYSRGYIAW